MLAAVAGIAMPATGGLNLNLTVTVTDPAGRRHAARVGRAGWTWLSDESADPAADSRVRRVLRQLRAEPDTALSNLRVLTAAERECHARLASSSVTGPGVNVVESLCRRALARPTDVAIVDGDATMSYADLDRAVRRCAAAFRAHGMRPGDVAALIMPRSSQLIVAILGALRAGVTFTIVNPDTPPARARRLVRDARARLAVAGQATDLPVPVLAPASLTAPDFRSEVDTEVSPSGRDAYVLFTSGSTGQPKGVTISRSALWRYLEAAIAVYELSPGDRVLQLAEPGFDVMLEEILPTLAAGASVVVADASCLDAPAQFGAYLRRHAVTVLNVPSSLWETLLRGERTFVAVGATVRLVVVGSERAAASVCAALRRLDRRLGMWKFIQLRSM